jgi:WD40 repeat protein
VPVFGVGHEGGHHYYVMQFIAGLGLDLVLEDLRRLRLVKSESGSAVGPEPLASAPGLTAADVARSLISGHFLPGGPIPLGETVTNAVAGERDTTPPLAAARRAAEPSSVVLPGSSGLSASSDPDRQYYCSVARIGIQVAEALEYANRQGVLHRDVKPSNLLLDGRGNVWVADFGLAKTSEADDLTHTGDILGTIRYMALERFQGKCDARSDVYSLGLTLYELVALRPAYEAKDRHTLMQRVLHEEPERLKKLAPSVPRDLETIIAKASARDSAGRYATAGALAEDLKRFVEDRPIRARRVSAAERLARWCRRNPWIAGSSGVAATALVGVAVMSLHYAGRQARHATELADANTQIRTALAESNRRLAMLDLERGQMAFEKGQIGVGMLWTVDSLRMATEAKDAAGRHVALANLSAWRRHHIELKGVLSHKDGIASVTFSPDGKAILTGGYDKTARLWDAHTGQPMGSVMEHSEWVSSVAFSPNGKTILSGSQDKTARLWDAHTGQPLGPPMEHSGPVSSVAFSPDGKTILIGSHDQTARLWDAATGRPIGQPLAHPSAVCAVTFSPDGQMILTGCFDNTARLWDTATGRPLGQPLVHSARVYAVAFSPEGKSILTGSWDNTAQLWDTATGRPLGQPLLHSGWVNSVAFSPDGKTILTGSDDKKAQLWDVATGQRVGKPMEHQGTVWSVTFSPDGRSILTGSRDHMARLWDCEVAQPIGRPLEYGCDVSAVAFSHDGNTLLAAGTDGKVRRWDVASRHLLGRPVEQGSEVTAVALSPDGKTILTGSSDTTARRWDTATGRPMGPPLEHSDTVTAVTFSPDGKTILSGSMDNTARKWDAATGRPLGDPIKHPRAVFSVAYSPDGKTILTGCFGTTAWQWDAATGRPIGQPLEHSGSVRSVAFSPDGKTILTGSNDNKARLWDTATGSPIGQPMEHMGMVWSVAFSPDGKTILTGSHDKTARLWDAATGRALGPSMRLPQFVAAVAFSQDGRFLLTSSGRTARRWDVPAPLPDDLPRLIVWADATTGLEMDEWGSIRLLGRAAWLERHRRLEQLGGPPPGDPAPRLDPILFGDDPAARGDAWKIRGMWDRAETAYIEAAHARPLNASVWLGLARLHLESGHRDRAMAALVEAVRLMPDDLQLRIDLSKTVLWSGDLAAWRMSNVTLLDQLGAPRNWQRTNSVAWACVLGPDATADAEVPIRLAELGLKGAPETGKANSLNTLGAAQYRAGRFDEAIGRLGEAIRLRDGVDDPVGCAFLAMAHHGLGHGDLARRWLKRLQEHQPSADFWGELEIRLLRREAEAVVLYDPAFPDDPLAR